MVEAQAREIEASCRDIKVRMNVDRGDRRADAIDRSTATEVVRTDHNVDGHGIALRNAVRRGQHLRSPDQDTAAELSVEDVLAR
jgi:hypothetical protein